MAVVLAVVARWWELVRRYGAVVAVGEVVAAATWAQHEGAGMVEMVGVGAVARVGDAGWEGTPV